MKRRSNSIVDNGYYSDAKRFYSYITRAVDNRRGRLTELLSDESYGRTVVGTAGRFAARRPSWHLEKDLLKRVNRKGFGSYVRDFGPIQPDDFSQVLQKAESLMTKKTRFTGSHRDLVAAALRVRYACKFPNHKFIPVTPETAAELQVNRRSSSSFPYFQRKGQVLDKLIHDCHEIIAGRLTECWNWPMIRGFRLQIRESFGQLSRKVRVMYPCPGAIILLEDCFIMPFIRHFITTDTFYVIGKTGKETGDLLLNRFGNSKRITSLDVSGFDQNLPNEAIILAFWILRSQLFLEQKMSIQYDKMVEYFCTSIMVSREPYVGTYAFIKDHGIPSGSGFTNMIGTIAHAIVLEYLAPNNLDKALICGDDNIFDSQKINLQQLYAGYESVFGLPISLEKTDNYKSVHKVKFLGFEFIDGIRYISPLLAINQMIWHPEFYIELDPFEREIARSASILLNGYNGISIFRKLFPDIIDKLDEGQDIRYTYLYGYSPPLRSRELLVLGQGYEVGINSSLREALTTGYLNR